MKSKEAQETMKENLLPLRLQFFASKEEDDKDEDDDKGGEPSDSEDNDDEGSKDQNAGEKMFTQSQVNKMMSREKKEGKSSMLKALGFSSEADAKKAVAMLNAMKSEDEKKKEDEDKLVEANARASAAENKLSCLTAGVSKDSLDDVLAIALRKVTDEKDLDSVLAEMKGQAKYASFFVAEEDEKKKDDGTGTNPGHSGKKKDGNKGRYGSQLAKSSVKSAESNKKSYFS